jgi:hypothetical protein
MILKCLDHYIGRIRQGCQWAGIKMAKQTLVAALSAQAIPAM